MTLHNGDCLDVMAAMDAESIDAIVTDPPYGLEFMGRAWDTFRVDDPGTNRNRGDNAGEHGRAGVDGRGAFGKVAYGGGKRPTTSRCTGCGKRDQFRNAHQCTEHARWVTEVIDPHAAPPTSLAYQEWTRLWAREAYRVAKPGAHLLAFGGTRIYHRLAAALEDAGWEIRDCLVWAYAQGFPKSHDVSAAIDRAAGVEREVIGQRGGRYETPKQDFRGGKLHAASDAPNAMFGAGTEPVTDAAKKWQGWGTALKPAWEPIVMARKPLRGSVASNVLAYGTGALNIGGNLIGDTKDVPASPRSNPTGGSSGGVYGEYQPPPADAQGFDPTVGRWPPNVLLTDPLFDGGAAGVVGGGPSVGVGVFPHTDNNSRADGRGLDTGRSRMSERLDAGTYSRFFLIPKAARSEREPVFGDLDERPFAMSGGAQAALSRGEEQYQEPADASTGLNVVKQRKNHHPTVKPIELMRHLVRLVTPPGGTVLDPFLGSGTTALAAELEGFAWIGIEREAEYVAIAEARLQGNQRGLGLDY